MASCYYCDITALGCSACDSPHTGLTTHIGHWQGLGSPILSAKVILNELILHLSAALLAEDNPHKASIDESLKRGTLSKFSRCLLSAAIQDFARKASQKLASEILPELEKTLIEDAEAKLAARKAAEEAAIERARIVAKKAAEEIATLVATEIANGLAPLEARKAAVDPARAEAAEVAARVAPEAAREAATKPARDIAAEIADNVAAEVAANIAKEVATSVAKDAAIQTAKTRATEVANELVSRKIAELDTKMELDDFINKQMTWFKTSPPDEVRRRVSKAAERAPRVMSKFNIDKAQETQVPRLALYDFLVLCDDSGSMKKGGEFRRETQAATVENLFRILRELGSEGKFSVIPFKGDQHRGINDEAGVKNALGSIGYNTGESALGPLEKRIIRPLEELAKSQKLPPTVVVVITDGDIGGIGDFSRAIKRFKHTLRENGYVGPAALFLVCRVGNDQEAANTLATLNTNPDINDMILYSTDRLDLKWNQGANDDKYIGWVVGQLLRAMGLQII